MKKRKDRGNEEGGKKKGVHILTSFDFPIGTIETTALSVMP